MVRRTRVGSAATLQGDICDDASRKSDQNEQPSWPSDRRAYFALLGCFLLMCNSSGLIASYGTVASYYKEHLLPDTDPLLVNLVGSTQTFLILSLSFFEGRIVDAGYARQANRIGLVFLSLGMFLLSIVNGKGERGDGKFALIWLTQGLLVGLGMSPFYVSSTTVAAGWFPKHRSLVIGSVGAGASISGIYFPIMFNELIAKVGFNVAVRWVAALSSGTGLVAVLLVKQNPDHPLHIPKKWTSAGAWFDREALRDASYCWFMAAIVFMYFGFWTVFFTLEGWAATNMLGYRDVSTSVFKREELKDRIRTFYLLCMMNGSSTVGRFAGAICGDRFSALSTHIVCTAIASLLLLCLWIPANNVPLAIAFAVSFGAISGAVVSLPAASIAYILGEERKQKLGQWTGMVMASSAPFALAGPIIVEGLVKKYDTYLTVHLWSGLCMAISSICMLVSFGYVRKSKAGQRHCVDLSTVQAAPLTA